MMENGILPNILVLSEDKSIWAALSGVYCNVSKLEGPARTAVESWSIGRYEIMIVDLQSVDKAGVAMLKKAIGDFPQAKIIGIKPPGPRNGLSGLGLDFFRCLERPVEPGRLVSAVRHALEIQGREKIISEMSQKLDAGACELVSLRRKLLKNNDALSTLTENIQREREQLEKLVALNLRSILIPSIDRLKKIKEIEPFAAELDLIISQVEDITSDFITDAKIVSKLSPAELRVASLIRNGLNTEEIAKRLNISSDTIMCHRKKIRKKLGINKAAYNLKNFLEARGGCGATNRA